MDNCSYELNLSKHPYPLQRLEQEQAINYCYQISNYFFTYAPWAMTQSHMRNLLLWNW